MAKVIIQKKGDSNRYKTGASWSQWSSGSLHTASTAGISGSSSVVYRIARRITRYNGGGTKDERFKYNKDGSPKRVVTNPSGDQSGGISVTVEIFMSFTHVYVASMNTGTFATGYNGKTNASSSVLTAGGNEIDFNAKTLV